MIPGLTPRALKAWCGTDRISALPKLLAERTLPSSTPAASVLALFVAGEDQPIDRLRALDLDALIANELVERTNDRVRVRVAVLPINTALLVCDRRDTPDDRDAVCWPDDSSLHLATAIPAGRRTSWLDIGCGSGFAQLARPELATELVGIDINPRARRYATLGATLSGLGARMRIIDAVDGRFDLVTCNAPLPADLASEAAVWRRADDGFFAWLWPAIAERVAPGGMAVVHAARRAMPDGLAGERTIVAYADEAVLWWRPDGDVGVVEVERALTVEQPHIEARDLDDARARDR
jgi:SAM-dependent methyltransferase